ncbi:MAG: hypothetical protein AABX51_07365 [Nanoarchaeota archaeon]
MAHKEKKGLNIFIIIPLVILVIFLLLVAFVYAMGGASIDKGIPSTGIVVINVPFNGNNQEYFPVQWQVAGGKQTLVSGVFFSDLPSQSDFSKSPPPDQTGYLGWIPAQEKTLSNGEKVFEAMIPNAYPVNNIRIYALIGETHYWSQEYQVTP